jgi:4-alpha-glucanotransferase
MNSYRSSGILLHPTSLPGTPGIGTIGKQAYKFVDWLKQSNQTLWQILPVGPTGYGDSPYAAFSTFAGNPLLIDLDMLKEKHWLSEEEIQPPDYIKTTGYIDFGSVVWWKTPVLRIAAKHFLKSAKKEDRDAYEIFKNDNASWLDNYGVFMDIKEYFDQKAKNENRFGAMWSNYWPQEYATRDPKTISTWQTDHVEGIEIVKVIQYFFFSQWHALKSYANKNGISIIGDIPIFVAADSADVWANQDLFQLDKQGHATAVAGVPPDYFSSTGQLWGNPLYDWDAMKKTNFKWWITRIKEMLSIVDYIRIDHFRGFEAYWAIPAGAPTAEKGKWMPGPGHALFDAIKKEFGNIPIIAEDLGLITEKVEKLRDDFNLPGMRVLQFAFDVNEAGSKGFTNSFLPHMYNQNCIVYTGTHDNETMQGWLDAAKPEEIELVKNYLTAAIPGLTYKDEQLCPALISTAFMSTAKFCVIPMQDLFSIGKEGRMNIPSTTGGINWQWRMEATHFSSEKSKWLKTLGNLSGRNV